MTRPMVWTKYAFHLHGCAALPIWPAMQDPPWPSHEAMVFDPRCDCGLRELAESMATEWPNGTRDYPIYYRVTVGG